MHVIGTAGHVDHGKTLLIEALTGINADRLPEEKRRGLTIDLGFAHFLTSEKEPVGVIDVPGHERFIRNMVAGAWSLDLALLTVAADDGWMRQSTDHTRVLRLMGVPKLIAVITKTDLSEAERVRQVTRQATVECRRLGYPGTPTVAVSARNGQGIENLKVLILQQLEELGPSRKSFSHLYVDRAFTVKGTGTVVTGSLKGGPLQQGEELLLLPKKVRVRVRGLQSYYRSCERVEPVIRLAINLGGIEAGQVERGDLLTGSENPFRVVKEFIARIQTGIGGDETSSLKRQTEVEFAAGTGHQIARLIRIAAGNLVRIRCSRPVPLLWNQPVVFIQHGGSAILGGGRVLWLGGGNRQQRNALAEIEPTLPAELGLEELSRLKLAMNGVLIPEDTRDLKLTAGFLKETTELGGWIMLRGYRGRLEKRIRELACEPGGVRVDELATKMRGEEKELLRLLSLELVKREELTLRAGILFPADEESPAVSLLGRRILQELRDGGSHGLEASKLKVAGGKNELRNLVRVDLAVTLDGEIYYEKQSYLGLVKTCLADLKTGGILTIADTKNRTGLSRKYVIPLLNRMESDGFVKRSGNDRIVTAKPD